MFKRDRDTEILGYNIFDRITKEGRKYGVLLGLITQRPSELSDTAISQCSNFLILRTLHPKDLEYIKEMVPNVSQEITLQLKNLKPGNCIALELLSKFLFKCISYHQIQLHCQITSIFIQSGINWDKFRKKNNYDLVKRQGNMLL